MAVQEVVDAVRRVHGFEMAIDRRCAVGAEGVYAGWLEGRRVAIRWWHGVPTAAFVPVHERLEVLRTRSVPIPEVVWSGVAEDTFVEVSAWVEGSIPVDAQSRHVEAALDVVEKMRGAAVGGGDDWRAFLLWSLDDEAVHFFRPARLLDHGHEPVLRDAQALLATIKPTDHSADDIVHCDFGLGNMLFVADGLSAVVDWSGCRDGSRAFDLTGLWWDLRLRHGVEAAAVEEALAECAKPDRIAATCHHAVRNVAAAIGRHDLARVLALARQELDRW